MGMQRECPSCVDGALAPASSRHGAKIEELGWTVKETERVLDLLQGLAKVTRR
jgi:hypothetical protein